MLKTLENFGVVSVRIFNPILRKSDPSKRLYIHAHAPLGCSIDEAEKFRDNLTKAIEFAKQKESEGL